MKRPDTPVEVDGVLAEDEWSGFGERSEQRNTFFVKFSHVI